MAGGLTFVRHADRKVTAAAGPTRYPAASAAIFVTVSVLVPAPAGYIMNGTGCR